MNSGLEKVLFVTGLASFVLEMDGFRVVIIVMGTLTFIVDDFL